MNNSPKEPRSWLLVGVVLVGCGVICALFLFGKSRTTAATDEMQRQVSDLKVQLDAQQQRVAVLEEEIRGLQSPAFVAGGQVEDPPPNSIHKIENNLARWIAESSRMQSNTGVLLERLLTGSQVATAPVLSSQKRQAEYTALEASTQTERQTLEARKSSTADLLFQLNVPDDVATMDASRGLDMPSLRPYWPYFEAKRKRDFCQRFVEALEMKLSQERIEAELNEARLQNP